MAHIERTKKQFAEIAIDELFFFDGYYYRRVAEFDHAEAGVNAMRQDNIYRHFQDADKVSVDG